MRVAGDIVDTNGFFSIHSVNLLYILDKCECVCVCGTHIDIVRVLHAMLSKIGIVDGAGGDGGSGSGSGGGGSCGENMGTFCALIAAAMTRIRALTLIHSHAHIVRINFAKGDQ